MTYTTVISQITGVVWQTSRGTPFLPQGQRVAETGYEPHKTVDYSCINKQHVTDIGTISGSEPWWGDGLEIKWGR